MKIILRRYWSFLMLVIISINTQIKAQPYFDVAGLSAWYIPAKGDSGLSEFSSTAFFALPMNIGKRDKIICIPVYESRRMEYLKTDTKYRFSSLSSLFIWQHESRDSCYTLALSFLPRTNSSKLAVNTTTLQPGAAILNTFRINPTLKLKVGLYYNQEYFGGFIIPLAGIDWKINDRWKLFGVLPNSMKLEYKIIKAVYAGMSFKTFTNSYKYENESGYVKIKDNHLCLFTDFYLPHKITISAELGHTFLREINNRSSISFAEARGNGLIVKCGIYYRVRFDDK